ncbi:COX assembly mitochondrial -like protein [Halotydeus destructor]|nr:COX assembly mitochondrial -like protein [Halotydeus destructor]
MSILSQNLTAGPKHVGDPDETTLRKVEREILIPKIMRDRANKEKCLLESEAYAACCKEAGLLMTFKCKPATKELVSCMDKWYKDEDFKKECTAMYLKDRTEYRRSGIAKKMRKKENDMI